MDFNFNMGTNNRINAAGGENTALRKEGEGYLPHLKLFFILHILQT